MAVAIDQPGTAQEVQPRPPVNAVFHLRHPFTLYERILLWVKERVTTL